VKRIVRRLIFPWELPQVILGILFLIVLKKKTIGLQYYEAANVYFVKGFPGGISLAFFIFLNSDEQGSTRAVKHEYGHTRQSLFLGWLYLIVVGFPSIIRAAIWNNSNLDSERYYRGFPENWADRLGRVSTHILPGD
jgi:hypothetical protein